MHDRLNTFVALSTWKHGFHPNGVTLEHLQNGGSALDAVELGAKYCESDLTCMSVGKGGIPDDEGFVTLDASIMDHEGNCGAVCFVQHYKHAISIARRMMEKNRHIMLAGSGAELFAEREGFERENLLTEKARALYDQWKAHPNKLRVRLRRATEGDHEYVFEEVDSRGALREIDRDSLNESHDTIGIIGLDSKGHLAGACTTSGLAFKQHGRVGDSPIIGSGLFVDGSIAAAVATGNGEFVMRACSSFHIVEQIRQGVEPDVALEHAITRIQNDRHLNDDVQVGLLVVRADGVWSARSLRSGFQFAAGTAEGNSLYDCTPHDYTLVNA